MRAAVFFDILSWWHAGTGRGAGPELDAVVFRTPGGLPCLPGRTVKGLLRHACTLAGRARVLDTGFVEAWFGSAIPPSREDDRREEHLEAARFRTSSGLLTFDSAILGETDEQARAWERWAATHPVERTELFSTLAATRIDEHGLAAAGSLRSIEVAVPMTLRAIIEGPEDPAWLEGLRHARCFIRGLGSHRHRGLGRAALRVEAA